MEKENNTAGFVEDVRDYLYTRTEIVKLEAADAASDFVARLAAFVVLLLLGSLTFAILSVAAGLWLGDLL